MKGKQDEIESLREYILKMGQADDLEYSGNDSVMQSIDSYIGNISELRANDESSIAILDSSAEAVEVEEAFRPSVPNNSDF
jgi:hypothetical protein